MLCERHSASTPATTRTPCRSTCGPSCRCERCWRRSLSCITSPRTTYRTPRSPTNAADATTTTSTVCSTTRPHAPALEDRGQFERRSSPRCRSSPPPTTPARPSDPPAAMEAALRSEPPIDSELRARLAGALRRRRHAHARQDLRPVAKLRSGAQAHQRARTPAVTGDERHSDASTNAPRDKLTGRRGVRAYRYLR